MMDLLKFSRKEPDSITEEDITDYLAHHRTKRNSSASTINLAYNGIKYFFNTLQKRDIIPPVTNRLASRRRGKKIPSAPNPWAVVRTESARASRS